MVGGQDDKIGILEDLERQLLSITGASPNERHHLDDKTNGGSRGY